LALTRNFAWLTAMLAVALLLLVASTLPVAPAVEAWSGALVDGVAAGARDATKPVTDLLLHAGQLEQLSEENARLRGDVARLEVELAAVREQERATAEVAALIEAVGTRPSTPVAASVMVRDANRAQAFLVISRGAEDHIAAGQAVLGPGAALVGVIEDVQAHRARVRLLSDAGSAVAVVAQRARVQGALAGDGHGGSLHLDFVALDAAIDVGDLIITSALGGVLPAGLPIGRVSAVARPEQELFASIEVAPLVDYSKLEHVIVLTGEEARAASAGPTRPAR